MRITDSVIQQVAKCLIAYTPRARSTLWFLGACFCYPLTSLRPSIATYSCLHLAPSSLRWSATITPISQLLLLSEIRKQKMHRAAHFSLRCIKWSCCSNQRVLSLVGFAPSGVNRNAAQKMSIGKNRNQEKHSETRTNSQLTGPEKIKEQKPSSYIQKLCEQPCTSSQMRKPWNSFFPRRPACHF